VAYPGCLGKKRPLNGWLLGVVIVVVVVVLTSSKFRCCDSTVLISNWHLHAASFAVSFWDCWLFLVIVVVVDFLILFWWSPVSLVVCVLTADRLSRLLERFGLSMSSLSQSGSLSLNTLVNIALTLGVQHTSDSEYVPVCFSVSVYCACFVFILVSKVCNRERLCVESLFFLLQSAFW